MPLSPSSTRRCKAFARTTSQTAAVSSGLAVSRRVHILPDIPSVDFDAAWERRVETVVGPASGLKANFISANDLIAAKLAAGDPRTSQTWTQSAKRQKAKHRDPQKKTPEPDAPNQ
jgi:hypothetical protein